MKRILLLVVIAAINQSIFSQDTEKKITVQSNPLLLFSDILIDEGDSLLAVDLEGQLRLTNYSNISLTLSFLTGKKSIWQYESDDGYEQRMYQFDVKPMYIQRPFGTGIEGFYLGFYPHAGFLNVKYKDEDRFFFEYGFGINIGYKWVFRSGFTMQLGGGIGKTFSYPEKKDEYIPINSDGRITAGYTDINILDFKLGYSF